MGKVKKFQNPQQKKIDAQFLNETSKNIRKEKNYLKT